MQTLTTIGNNIQPDGYKSFDTFGGEKAAAMLSQSMVTLDDPN